MCTPVITVALFAIATIWKPPKALLTDDWMKKMCYIYTMEYYSAITRNDILPSAAAWMNLNNIILSEISQTDKDKYLQIFDRQIKTNIMQYHLNVKSTKYNKLVNMTKKEADS